MYSSLQVLRDHLPVVLRADDGEPIVECPAAGPADARPLSLLLIDAMIVNSAVPESEID